MTKKLKLLFITLFLILITITPSYAHWSDMSAIELNVYKNHADSELIIPTPFLIKYDVNSDKFLSDEEIKNNIKEINNLLSENIYLKVNNEKKYFNISYTSKQIELDSNNSHTTLNLNLLLEDLPKEISLHYSLFSKESNDSNCLATITYENDKISTFVFKKDNTDYLIKKMNLIDVVKQFLLLGIEHIATGYDHILFLLALLLAGGNFKYLLKIITTFTIAHSLTLSLSVLDIITLPSQFIEVFIAASIIYVSAENFWRKSDEANLYLVFTFGLIHGFGFSNILKEINIQSTQLFSSLASFNIGLEFGQVIIVYLSWILLNFLKEYNQFKLLKNVSSFVIILIASFWFYQRAFISL